MAAERFEHDRYLIDQLVRPVVNLYRITPLAAGETPTGDPVAFVRQKRMALREDIRFFADDSEADELFRIKARRMLDIGGRYDVANAAGEPIGVLEHAFRQSLLRSTWNVLDPQEQLVATAQERSVAVAIIRRVIGFVPYGELVPIPYHFAISVDGREAGELRRQWALRDRYTLDLSGDADRRIDRRLAIALAIALDALQGR